MLGPQRFTLVPWLHKSDLEEGRARLWELTHHDTHIASCWSVTVPAVETREAYMVVRAARGNGNDGGTITLSLHDSPHFDVYAKETFAMQHASPRAPRFWCRDRDSGDEA